MTESKNRQLILVSLTSKACFGCKKFRNADWDKIKTALKSSKVYNIVIEDIELQTLSLSGLSKTYPDILHKITSFPTFFLFDMNDWNTMKSSPDKSITDLNINKYYIFGKTYVDGSVNDDKDAPNLNYDSMLAWINNVYNKIYPSAYESMTPENLGVKHLTCSIQPMFKPRT